MCDECDLKDIEITQLMDESENWEYEYKAAAEENEKLDTQNTQLQSHVDDLVKELDDKNEEIANIETKVEDLETDLDDATAKAEKYDQLISYLEDMWPEAITDLTIRGDI